MPTSFSWEQQNIFLWKQKYFVFFGQKTPRSFDQLHNDSTTEPSWHTFYQTARPWFAYIFCNHSKLCPAAPVGKLHPLRFHLIRWPKRNAIDITSAISASPKYYGWDLVLPISMTDIAVETLYSPQPTTETGRKRPRKESAFVSQDFKVTAPTWTNHFWWRTASWSRSNKTIVSYSVVGNHAKTTCKTRICFEHVFALP